LAIIPRLAPCVLDLVEPAARDLVFAVRALLALLAALALLLAALLAAVRALAALEAFRAACRLATAAVLDSLVEVLVPLR